MARVWHATMAATLRALTVPALEAIPGLVHGFEQRLGPPGWETRTAGRRRVAQALAPAGRLLLLRQVHGATVHAAPWEGTPEGDAATTDVPGYLLGIETADCLPILLVDVGRRLAGAVHAGWRGAAAGVAARGVEALVALGSDPGDVLAALGPAIGPCCYEVGDELREAFGTAGKNFFRAGPRRRPHLDVRAVTMSQLVEAGVDPGRIFSLDDCTYCRPDLYHSYRREGPGGGRMVSYVGWTG